MQASIIANNLEAIRGTLPNKVKLIAVSKTRSLEEIEEAVISGCKDFGENKAQELCKKYEAFPNLNWHFIGTLQKNKIKMLVGKACLIQSVDSFELAEEIENRAAKLNLVQDILIQVNPAGEEQKRGISINDAENLYNSIKDFTHIRVLGLMQIAPNDKEDIIRPFFKQANNLKEKLGLEVLSMGMSNDYKLAIEEGSNMVRIGSAIFGQRVYKERKE